MLKIKAIGLSLSNKCGATCIYCPSTKTRSGNMSLELVKNVVSEINSKEFKSKNDLKRISVSENGDATLNPEFINILRHLRTIEPKIHIGCNTTFNNIPKELSEIIIKEKLIDEIITYVDGNTDKYEHVKHVSYLKTENNLSDFLKIRDNNIKINIFYLGFGTYINAIYQAFGFIPERIENEKFTASEILKDDFENIKEKWKEMLIEGDTIQRSMILSWAERNSIIKLQHDQKKFVCPLLKKVESECFIAPNGDVYSCCFDDRQALKFGNINNESIDSIFRSNKKLEFINNLKNKEYEKIGYPCDLVESCQNINDFPYEKISLNISKKVYKFIKKIACGIV